MSLLLTEQKELFVSPETFLLESGQRLSGLDIVYQIHGPEGAPLVAVLGGISAGSSPGQHPGDPESGWWRHIVGPGLALDSEGYRVLGIEFLAGPACPMRLAGDIEITQVTPRDQARALARLLRELDLGTLHAFVGASYGGMVGLCLAEEASDLLDRLCVISAAHRPDAWAQALRSQQRRILRLGRGTAHAKECTAIARALAMLSYRSQQEFEQRFDTWAQDGGGSPRFACEEYLEARGSVFAESFDADAYLSLSQAIDLQDVDPARVDVPTLLISVASDLIVPLALVTELHAALPQPLDHRCIDSLYGHDAFLKEADLLSPLLRDFLIGGAS